MRNSESVPTKAENRYCFIETDVSTSIYECLSCLHAFSFLSEALDAIRKSLLIPSLGEFHLSLSREVAHQIFIPDVSAPPLPLFSPSALSPQLCWLERFAVRSMASSSGEHVGHGSHGEHVPTASAPLTVYT